MAGANLGYYFWRPQGSVLVPLLFLLYINHLSDDISSQIRVFADDCIIHLELSSAKSPEQHQSDLSMSWQKANAFQLEQVL